MREKCWNILACSSLDTPAPSLNSWHKEFSLKKKYIWFLEQMNNCSLCWIYIWNHLGNSDGTQFPWQNSACLRVFLPVQSLQMIEQWGLCNVLPLFFGMFFFFFNGVVVEFRVSCVMHDITVEKHLKVLLVRVTDDFDILDGYNHSALRRISKITENWQSKKTEESLHIRSEVKKSWSS